MLNQRLSIEGFIVKWNTFNFMVCFEVEDTELKGLMVSQIP